MSQRTDSAPSDERHIELHRRLAAFDPIAPNDLATEFLEPLIAWLTARNPGVDPHWSAEAAEDAIRNLSRNPLIFQPEEKSLEQFLQMSAQRDLQNILARERRHQSHYRSVDSVELSEWEGKYLETEEDPSTRLESEEELAKLDRGILQVVRRGLTPEDLAALDLLLEGKRETVRYAEVLGITDHPSDEQERRVKQVKDRLKKRLERAWREYEQSP